VRHLVLRSASILIAMLGACDAREPTASPTPPVAEAPTSPPTTTPPTTSPPPPTRATEVLQRCGIAEPARACTTDNDCAIVGVTYGECGGCPETLEIGVSAASRRSFLAASKCNRPACDKPQVSCLVHWHHAEDGPDHPPQRTTVKARCIASAGSEGVCRTYYAPQ
jgi:hypothetical protein